MNTGNRSNFGWVAAAFLLAVLGLCCFGNEGRSRCGSEPCDAEVPTIPLDSKSPSPFHKDNVPVFGGSDRPTPFFAGFRFENRLTESLTTHGVPSPQISSGKFSFRGILCDVPSYYEGIRPHLLLCRLQI